MYLLAILLPLNSEVHVLLLYMEVAQTFFPGLRIRIDLMRIRIDLIWIRIQNFSNYGSGFGLSSGSRVLMTKNWKKIKADKKLYFFDQKLQFTNP
jgi:hypothetical protein